MSERWTTERIERELGTVEHLAENIVTVWCDATASQDAEGRSWYPLAHWLASTVSEEPGIGAAVAAALSPRFDWQYEVEVLQGLAADREAYVSDDCGALLRNVVKANDILSGLSPEDVLGGYKVKAFYRLLCDPYSPTEVCVDTWAIRVALNEYVGDAEAKPVFASATVYSHFQEAYRLAGKRLGELPSTVQAVTWTAIRAQSWRGRREAA